MTLTVTDLFAGAGGSSTGMASVPGVEVRYAANHWQLAVDVHNANHPSTDHLCADISQYDPKRLAATDVLWGSPECTWHSKARGRAPAQHDPNQDTLYGEKPASPEAAERSRATMWDIPRFAEIHHYPLIIVENVVEAARKWVMWKAWLMAMDLLGYDHDVVCLNSAHAHLGGLPAPQSRDRIYVVFWKRGTRRGAPDLERVRRPKAYCPSCDQVVDAMQVWKPASVKKFGQIGEYGRGGQYLYACPQKTCRGAYVTPNWLPAITAIDLSVPMVTIGERKANGLRELVPNSRRRVVHGIARHWGPLHVETANGYDAANPSHPRHGDPNAYYRAWSVEEPIRTLPTWESKAFALPPLHVSLMGTSEAHLRNSARPVDEALRTLTASGNNDYLLTPPLMSAYYGTSDTAVPATDRTMGTLTTKERYALVVRNNGTKGNLAWASTPVTETLRTLTSKTPHALLTQPGREVTVEDVRAAEAIVDECGYRMFEPHENAAGMAFPREYLWEGDREDRTKMAGNAVTPPTSRDLMIVGAEYLAGAA